MKKIIYLSLILSFFAVNLSAITNFTPTIDGIKEASWGTTPDATSASTGGMNGVTTYHSANACQDIYVTDDPNYLYIGYYYNGDVSVDGLTNFAFTSSYTVIASVRDGGGNTIEKEWLFTVRPPDTDVPIITGLMPADTAEDVPISSSISFNVQDNYGVLSNEISVTVNGVVAFSNGSFTADYAGGGSALIANAQNGYAVVIDPIKDFDYSTDVNISISIKDTSNNSSQYNVSFKVLELKAARPVSNVISPKSGNSTIKIKINRTGYATVKVYNIRGEVVFTIPNTYYQAGISFVEWDGTIRSSLRAVGSGYYFVRIKGSDIDTTVKVVVVK